MGNEATATLSVLEKANKSTPQALGSHLACNPPLVPPRVWMASGLTFRRAEAGTRQEQAKGWKGPSMLWRQSHNRQHRKAAKRCMYFVPQ